MNRLKILLNFMFFGSFCNSQNLINNGGFEEYKKCPNDFSQIDRAIGWKTPSEGTSDYFNSCSKSIICSVPKNHGGIIYAKNGHAYAGIAMAFDSSPNFRYEFIQTKLTKALKKEGYYCLSLFVQRAKISTVDYSSFSFLISNEKLKIKNWNFIDRSDLDANIYLKKQIDYTKKNIWLPICILFRAKGGERYLTIGYDKILDIPKSKSKLKNKEQALYYYIDDVSLIEIKDSSECICKIEMPYVEEEKIKVDTVKSVSLFDEAKETTLVLKNIYFETDKSNLLSNSYNELEGLVNYLKKNPTFKIEILGYTDNTGNEEKNQILSEQRAKAVAEYLTKKDIFKERVSYKGFGSKNPIAPNDTEVNKAKNRRVEIKILP